MLNRRKFIRNTAVGTAAFAGGSGIFFPKPAISASINYLLSKDGPSDAVLRTLTTSNIAQGASETLPPMTDPAIVRVVQDVQTRFVQDNFTDNQTPFTKRLGNVNNPLWGQQRNETLGPNPGFGTVQIRRNRAEPIAFTGSTTAGIDRAILILSDEQYQADELDNALMPVRERFEDWGTWAGDVDPSTGEIINTTSLTNYETRFGSVLRRYTVEEPGPGGFGIIRFDIRGGQRINARIEVRVDFA